MTPPLSVVIPSYSRADLLQLALQSLARFAPTGTEIVVVDDHSTGEIVSRAAAAFAGVRVIRLPRRSGFCVAANTGVAAATATVVELLNDDAEVTAGWADAALRWFADPRIGAVAPLVLQNDPDRQAHGRPPLIDSAGDEYDPGGFARKRGHGMPYHPAAGQHLPANPGAGPVWGASAAAAFYRRDAVRAAGGFPECFGAYFEDVDLAHRLRRFGYDTWFDPESVVWHRVSASYGRRPVRWVVEQQSCNEERVFWRNTHGRARVQNLPRHAVVLVAKAARRLAEGTFVPWATGRFRAWTDSVLPSMRGVLLDSERVGVYQGIVPHPGLSKKDS